MRATFKSHYNHLSKHPNYLVIIIKQSLIITVKQYIKSKNNQS